MSNLAIVFICLALGWLFRRLQLFPEGAHLTLNNFVIYVSLPALSLLHIPQISMDWALLAPIATAWIVFIVAMVLFPILGRLLGWDKATVGCAILCCGLFNSSFIGFPVIEALYGAAGLQQAILVDQPGSFVVLSTLGIFTAVWYSSGKPTFWLISQKLFSFPPLLAFAVAVVLWLFNFEHTELTASILQPLAATITPVALVSVGMQLKLQSGGIQHKALWPGLLYSLLLAPALLLSLYDGVFAVEGLPLHVSVLEAAMAPMITGAIIASQYNLNPKLASQFIGIGIPLSFVTLAGWYYLLAALG